MKVLKKIFTFFIRGLVLTAPLFVTFYALWFVFSWLDENVTNLTEFVTGKRIHGVGIIAIFLLITLIGLLGSTFLLRPFLVLLEDVLERMPIVKDIYGSMRDFIEAFIGNKAKFKHPVTIEMPNEKGVHRIGFITQNDLSVINKHDKVAVYIPFSYSIAGIVVLVNKEQVQPLEGVTAAEAMKFVLSGGVAHFKE
ncbi:MAG: DUF502 domain-containing protein [Chitinophagales bacterium]|nr:DUF502 domain-containing protein [Chitinophagales bacterium]MDW8272740.1 DUF502 domain-containing protein [Chitinophagales bacterium]